MCKLGFQIKRREEGGLGGGRSASPKAEWQYLSVLLCAVEYGTPGFRVCIYIYINGNSRYTHIYIMHNMPVVSECKLNQEDIVGEPLSTSVQCPEIPLSASFLPSFPPSPPSLLPSFLAGARAFPSAVHIGEGRRSARLIAEAWTSNATLQRDGRAATRETQHRACACAAVRKPPLLPARSWGKSGARRRPARQTWYNKIEVYRHYIYIYIRPLSWRQGWSRRSPERKRAPPQSSP